MKKYIVFCPRCKKNYTSEIQKNLVCNKCRKENKLYYPGWLNIKKEVFTRDNNLCQICKRNIKILIHHIDGKKRNNRLDNLIVLCNQCHTSIHGMKRHHGVHILSLKTLTAFIKRLKVSYEEHGIRLSYQPY